MDLPNDTFFQLNPATRIQWDGGLSYYRDAWQWDMCPTNYQCHTYDSKGNPASSYDEAPATGADMGLLTAWQYTKGKGVVVAIADGGIDINHPDIKNRVIGGVAISPSVDWTVDTTGHGTAMASVIAAECNNGIGLAGIAPEASIYMIKCQFNSIAIRPAIAAAKVAGASILVMPWGFTANDPLAREAIASSGLTVVCSALNSGVDEWTKIDYPINWQLSNVLAVSSSTMADVAYPVAAFSTNSVHLHAPGRIIPIALKGGTNYVYTSGTSFAAAKVAGAVALIKAARPGVDAVQELLAAVDKLPSLAGKSITGGRLNYRWAITGPEQTITREGLVLRGPAYCVFSVSISHDLCTWTALPDIIAGAAGYVTLPSTLDGQAFYQTRLKFAR